MSLLVLIATLCIGSAVGQVQVPCYGEGCVNVTVYLGPRWGSRVVMVPRTRNMTLPGGNSTAFNGTELGGEVDRFERYDERFHRPQHRPVPPDGDTQVEFMDDESPVESLTTTQRSRSSYKSYFRSPWLAPSTTRRPSEYHRSIPTNHPYREVRVEIDKYGRGTVDLSWRGYSGEDVKTALISLPASDRRQVTRLVLDGNSIRYLPVLVFPVELEYGLQELSLNHNPFSPPYLTSYTRFELSRLGRLLTLNMSHCGLRSIEVPDLPSLELLDLSYNDLTYLPPSLGRLSGLVKLFLRGNRLSYISDSPLSSLTNLWVLDLGDNGLQEIWGEPLQNLAYLGTVKLDNNQLQSLPLLDSERTKIVSLANNSLQCSCDLLQSLQNIQLQDDQRISTKCQHENRTFSLLNLRMWPEMHQYLCDQGSWGSRAWTGLGRWWNQNSGILTAKVVWFLVGMTILAIVACGATERRRKKLRRLSGNVKPKGIPYNILDDQQVSTFSGPQSHV